MKKAEQKYKTEKKTYIVGFWMTADSALFQDPLSVSCLALFRKLPIIRQRKSRFIIFKTFDRKKEKLLVEFKFTKWDASYGLLYIFERIDSFVTKFSFSLNFWARDLLTSHYSNWNMWAVRAKSPGGSTSIQTCASLFI